jgi:hypothetical protein
MGQEVEAAIDQATVQRETLLRMLSARARPGERPEDVLIDLGLVSDRELAFQLSHASGRPLVGLRGFVPDPKLFLYVPLSLAASERICPLSLRGDRLELASVFLDPDLSYLTERFPNLELELVLAARDDVLAALQLARTEEP